jgi:hypothetical protein
MNPLLEKLAQHVDGLGALLDNLRVGVLGGEARERTLARVDELLALVKGEK